MNLVMLFKCMFLMKKNDIPEYILPTKEAAEFSSIAKEFLIWPYLNGIMEDQICVLQLWSICEIDKNKAWEVYLF